jgi:hypothetical protein
VLGQIHHRHDRIAAFRRQSHIDSSINGCDKDQYRAFDARGCLEF